MGPSRQATIPSPSQSDVDFQDLNWKAYVSNLQQEETRNTPAGEMWGRALRLSAPTPQVYDIKLLVGVGSPAEPDCPFLPSAEGFKILASLALCWVYLHRSSRRAGWRKPPRGKAINSISMHCFY